MFDDEAPKKKKKPSTSAAAQVVRHYVDHYEKRYQVPYRVEDFEWVKLSSIVRARMKAGYTIDDMKDVITYLFTSSNDPFLSKQTKTFYQIMSSFVLQTVVPYLILWRKLTQEETQ